MTSTSRNNWTPWAIKKARDAAPGHLASFQKAVKAGVKIANGTYLTPIAETTPGEIEQLVRAGLSEMEAIIAATRTAAELCGVEDELGTIETGKLADMIVVREEPARRHLAPAGDPDGYEETDRSSTRTCREWR